MDADELDTRNARLLRDVADASLTLTTTERRCLQYLSYGLTPHMTADALYLSRSSVHRCLQHAQIKLSAKTVTHACCLALRLGLID